MLYDERTMYTIKEASSRSGVGVQLLRAWERRYGVVQPTRTPSGYRLYDEDAIARLIAMRLLIDEGWAPQQAAARVRDADPAVLGGLVPTDAGSPGLEASPAAVEPERSDELVERLVAAAGSLDMAALEAALDEALASVRFEAAWDLVLGPALRRIGEAWERGEVTVAGEHATSEAIGRRLAMAFDAAGTGSADRPVLVGLPPGARHEFGALAFAIAARRAGLPILYLGADLPVDSWRSAASERDATAAVIGVPRPGDASRAREVHEGLRQERPGIRIILGGSGAERAKAGSADVAPSIDDAVALLAPKA